MRFTGPAQPIFPRPPAPLRAPPHPLRRFGRASLNRSCAFPPRAMTRIAYIVSDGKSTPSRRKNRRRRTGATPSGTATTGMGYGPPVPRPRPAVARPRPRLTTRARPTAGASRPPLPEPHTPVSPEPSSAISLPRPDRETHDLLIRPRPPRIASATFVHRRSGARAFEPRPPTIKHRRSAAPPSSQPLNALALRLRYCTTAAPLIVLPWTPQ